VSKKILSDYPRGFRNGFPWWRLSVSNALPVALALTVPFLSARHRGPVSLLGLPPRPCPRQFPALVAAKALSRVSRSKALLASFEQAPPRPGPARQPLPPAGLLILGMACRILGRAHGRSLLPEALAPEGNALLSGAQQIFGSVRTQQLYRKRSDARGFVSSVFSPSVAPPLWAFGPDNFSLTSSWFLPPVSQHCFLLKPVPAQLVSSHRH
jgi:hypothetical protein